MFEIVKNVIESGRYELRDMLSKLDKLWVQGDLSDSNREDLVLLAQEKATPDMGYLGLEEQVKALREELAELSARVLGLENGESIESEGGGEEAKDEYPEYRQPTCAEDAYLTGAKMTYNGKRYECIAPEGYAVTYPPDVFPSMWREISE